MTSPAPKLYRTPDGSLWLLRVQDPPHPTLYEWIVDENGRSAICFAAERSYVEEKWGPITPVRVVDADETGSTR